MRTRTRPIKRWWECRCVRCGRYYVTARRHSETCSDACRQQLHRGRERLYPRECTLAGRGETMPLSRSQQGALSAAGRELAAAAARARDRLADATPTERLLWGDAMAEQIVAAQPASSPPPPDPLAPGGLVDAALGEIGLGTLPDDKVSYDRARKRVVNMLARRRATEQDREFIRQAWAVIQAYNTYYRPEGSAAGKTSSPRYISFRFSSRPAGRT